MLVEVFLNNGNLYPTAKMFLTKLQAVNPLTTNEDYSRRRNSVACYQLVQSVLKIGSAVAERVGQGEVGGCTTFADSAWWLLQLVAVAAGYRTRA